MDTARVSLDDRHDSIVHSVAREAMIVGHINHSPRLHWVGGSRLQFMEHRPYNLVRLLLQREFGGRPLRQVASERATHR